MATLTVPSQNSLIDQFNRFLSQLKADFQKYQEYRSVLAELKALNARELADLGLSSHSAEVIRISRSVWRRSGQITSQSRFFVAKE